MITRFSVFSHCNDLGGKVWNPAIRWTHKYAVFVLLETDQDIAGLGECWCFDSKPDALIAYLKTEIAPLVVGKNFAGLAEVSHGLLSRATLTARHGMLASAWSGIDIALWDIKSRQAGLPLWQCLRKHRQSVQPCANKDFVVYGSGGLYGKNKTINDLVNEMQFIESMGFALLKMKVGGLPIVQDAERVNAVLEALNGSCNLIIDGVYSYTAAEAETLYRSIQHKPVTQQKQKLHPSSANSTSRIMVFQSPVRASDLAGMQALCAAGIPVMGTEAEYRYELQHELANSGAVRYLQVAPIAIGGISRVLELADSVPPPVRLSMEVSSTAVAFSTALQLALACDEIAHVEYHFVHQVFFDTLPIYSELFSEGESSFTDKAGIGIGIEDVDVTVEFESSIQKPV